MPTPGIVPSQPRTFKDNSLGKCLHESWQNADEIAQQTAMLGSLGIRFSGSFDRQYALLFVRPHHLWWRTKSAVLAFDQFFFDRLDALSNIACFE